MPDVFLPAPNPQPTLDRTARLPASAGVGVATRLIAMNAGAAMLQLRPADARLLQGVIVPRAFAGRRFASGVLIPRRAHAATNVMLAGADTPLLAGADTPLLWGDE